MNLMPKVHKLSTAASPLNEGELKGRPIITAHSWCTVEASRFLQSKLREIISSFKTYLCAHGMECTILSDSKSLVDSLKQYRVNSDGYYTFVSFDFKDLYTNILYEDASKTLRDLGKLLGIKGVEVELILDLYRFCNDWNYFNVGEDLFKQVKGVSMGCYFSKEISDLVLLYSEYKYLTAFKNDNLVLLRRYADDGLAIFSSHDLDDITVELQKIMYFYPRNLVININLNRATCCYLDLRITNDDVCEQTGHFHVCTYFKKFHKFAYLDPASNHPRHVFKGLVKTECMRYLRNSSVREDYDHTVQLFVMRLVRLGYRRSFILQNIPDYGSYKEGFSPRKQPFIVEGRQKSFVYTMTYDKYSKITKKVEGMLRQARGRLELPNRVIICKRVLPKLRGILSTRRLLHAKMRKFSFKV